MRKRRSEVHPCTRPRILDFVRRAGRATRPEISKELDATAVTVCKQVRRLLRERFLALADRVPRTRPGRRPDTLTLNADAGLTVGVDLQPDLVRGVLCDFLSNVREVSVEKVRAHSASEYTSALHRLITRLVSKAGQKRLFGLCVALAGPVSRDRRVSVSLPYCDDWRNVPLREMLESSHGLPTRIEECSNVGALAWHWLERHEADSGLILLDLRYGIGAGVVIAGEIWRGAQGAAGEIGHVVVKPDGPPCYCGNRGCLESMVLGRGLLDRLPEAPASEREPPGAALRVYARAAEGDRAALRAVHEASEHLARVLGAIITIFNPSEVVLSGEDTPVLSLLGEGLSERVRAYTYPPSFPSTRFSTVRLEPFFFARGATFLMLKEMFSPDVDVVTMV
ncbi:MAG: ROK family protein [Planctomycetota bacterium]